MVFVSLFYLVMLFNNVVLYCCSVALLYIVVSHFLPQCGAHARLDSFSSCFIESYFNTLIIQFHAQIAQIER